METAAPASVVVATGVGSKSSRESGNGVNVAGGSRDLRYSSKEATTGEALCHVRYLCNKPEVVSPICDLKRGQHVQRTVHSLSVVADDEGAIVDEFGLFDEALECHSASQEGFGILELQIQGQALVSLGAPDVWKLADYSHSYCRLRVPRCRTS